MFSMFRTIKAKLLLVITLLVLVPCLFLTKYAYQSRVSIFNESVDQTLSTAQQALVNAQLALISKGLNYGHFFMQDSGLRDAVFYNTMTGDNSNLLASLAGYYESLDLNNIEFTSRDGIVLGRGHQPEKYGDSKLDFPFTRTMLENQKASWDMEIGKHGVTLKFGSPVFSGEEFLGFVGYGYFIDQAFLDSIKKVINAELFYILKKDKQLIASTKAEIAVADFDTQRLENSLDGGNELERERKMASGYNAVGYIPVLDSADDVFAAMVVMKDISSEVAARNASLTFSIMILAVFVILGVVAAVFISVRIVATPLRRVTGIMENIANGDLTSEIDVNRQDELGLLLRSMQTMQEKLTDTIGTIRITAQQVSSASQSISGSTGEMSQGATQQASASEEASSSMEEMSSNIRQNADNAQSTEKIAIKAATGAREGGEAVTITVSAMNEIAEKITIVEEIARQTNMLALNAAIEAARAGEHGKGFAVVAAEVRKLAERSQTAAAEISELSGSSVEVAQKAGQILEKMVPDIEQTAELVQEITAASNEQNSGVDQINRAIGQLDQVTQQNSSAAEELSSTAEELAAQAEQLVQTLSYFKVGYGGVDNNGKRLLEEIGEIGQPSMAPITTGVSANSIDRVSLTGSGQNVLREGTSIEMGQDISDEDAEELGFQKH